MLHIAELPPAGARACELVLRLPGGLDSQEPAEPPSVTFEPD